MATQYRDPRPGSAIELRQIVVRQRMAERVHEADCRRLAGRTSQASPNGQLLQTLSVAAGRGIASGWVLARKAPVPRKVRARLGLILAAIVLSGCGASAPSRPVPTTDPTAHPTAASTPIAVVASAAATPTDAPTSVPPRSSSCGSAAAPVSGTGVTLYYNPYPELDNQVELISAAGQRVLIDVGDPDALSRPARKDDILLTTHEPQSYVDWYEPDTNFNPDFAATFPGRMVPEGGSISQGDFKVTGIAAAHGTTDSPASIVDRSDNIYLIEVGGLRIANFGDFGQYALTQSQLDRLGRVDVVMTQFDNSYSSVSAHNHLAFDMLGQLCPKIVIPTDLASEQDDLAVARTFFAVEQYTPSIHVHLTPATLPAKTTMLLMGDRGKRLGPAQGFTLSTF